MATLGFFMKQLLDAVLELIGPVLALILNPRPVMPQLGCLHCSFDDRIVDAIELEREEQQTYRRVGQPLGNIAVEFRDRRIEAVAGMPQPRIAPQAPGEIVDRLEPLARFGEPAAAPLPCRPR